MRRFNLSDPEFEFDPSDPEGFRSGRVRPARDAAKRTGASVYDLPPGQAVCPYHYELGEEEWLLVLEGRPTLRTPDGEEQLDPFDMVFFPTGSEGAHKITNATDSAVRIVMWSEVAYPSASVYPDSDKLGVRGPGGTDRLMVRRSSGVEYYDGET